MRSATTNTIFSLLVYFLLIIHHATFSLTYNKNDVNDSIHDDCNINMIKWRIGAIINPKTRVGKEQKIAMEMAVDDFNAQNSKCPELGFNFAYYSHGPAASLGKFSLFLYIYI